MAPQPQHPAGPAVTDPAVEAARLYETASRSDLDLAISAIGANARYGGLLECALAGIYAERAAVVAWLRVMAAENPRELAGDPVHAFDCIGYSEGCACCGVHLASLIQHGEHIKAKP